MSAVFTMRRSLCLLCVALWLSGALAKPAKAPQTKGKPASVDDVNVLMYGVLQFSESLHHMYQTTEAKIARILRSIHKTESIVTRLGQDTEEAEQTNSQVKERLNLIKAQMAGLQAQAEQTKGIVIKAAEEGEDLKSKLTNLETNLKISPPNQIRALKEMTLRNSSVLKDLMKLTVEQKQTLENQNEQLAELQRKASLDLNSRPV
ncbi:uncharacterized protein angptl8 [Chanos chanos]|uniref:Uncharacterized protein LOC115826948 n=1 Tax=Chanos chanos TaxID=29144 RepID=A0A6J2WPU0_CHACN|nr:uncharacterized protein LOC115826948 [Chanos chanos]XP_030646759.1 uncharacterized protein LOC115826948 [Chanos chanos]